MSDPEFRAERDDFIAFSLAAADLLLSVEDDDRIRHAMGATKSLLKQTPTTLATLPLMSLFDGPEASFIAYLMHAARRHGRIEPTVVMLGRAGEDKVPANIGISYLPARSLLYVALTILPQLVVQSLPHRDSESGLLDAKTFGEVASKTAMATDMAAGADGLRELRMIRLQGLPTALERLPTSRARRVMSEVGAFLRAQACNGGLAAQLDAERFGFLARGESGPEIIKTLSDQVTAVLTKCGVDTSMVRPSAEAVALDLKDVSATDAAKAMAFAISEFGKAGGLGMTSMSDCLENVLQSTVGKVNRVRSCIQDKRFTLAYQPIVDILSREVHHYEALLRFEDTPSPFELITFAERVGLTCEIDAAVVDMALDNMRLHPDEQVAVNISGSSIQNDAFRTALLRQMDAAKAYAGNLMFELTESALVEDMENVAKYIQCLRKRGHKVSLDDFGAGANAYNYLRSFDADHVKIDGPFLKAALRDDRQRALVKSIVLLCHDLGIEMIGEMIETEQMAQAAASLGIEYGQGYLFGRPQASLISPTQSLRRKGEMETWQ